MCKSVCDCGCECDCVNLCVHKRNAKSSRKCQQRISLAVPVLGLHASTAGSVGLIPGQELRSYKLQSIHIVVNRELKGKTAGFNPHIYMSLTGE